MTNDTCALDDIAVAAPCRASWANMQGDEQVRFCADCRRHVYNLSGMARAEAEALVREKEGRLCVRFYRRSDGTMLTRDCPVGIYDRRWRVIMSFVFGGIVLLTAALAGFGWLASRDEPGQSPLEQMLHKFFPRPTPTLVMGEPCVVPKPGPAVLPNPVVQDQEN